MQKQIKILLTILMALALAVSCAKNNPNNPNNDSNNNNNNNNNNQTEKPAWKQNANYSILIQDWYNEEQPQYNEVYQIRENGNDKVDFLVPEPSGELSYSIVVTEIVWNSDNTSGIMYGTYNVAPSWSPDYLNKWYAISFKGLSANSLSLSQAMLSDGTAAVDTLEEAKSKFTVENNAFAQYSNLVPQTK
ncbi:hypothetical protein R4J17_00445 [Brachyspira intermedia]|uniref:hypothetical protein n=1 Tax=Brachyspira intermedia TaxID=84377 RepID=UPI003005D691